MYAKTYAVARALKCYARMPTCSRTRTVEVQLTCCTVPQREPRQGVAELEWLIQGRY